MDEGLHPPDCVKQSNVRVAEVTWVGFHRDMAGRGRSGRRK